MGFRIDLFSIFPKMLEEFSAHSLIGKAKESGELDITVYDIRRWGLGERGQVDDSPYGGGAGMVMAPGPIFDAFDEVDPVRPRLFVSPRGKRFDHNYAAKLAQGAGMTIVCGRYEGVDQRVIDELIDDEVSIGDYVLAGGEVACLVVVEAVTRLISGVIGNEGSLEEESFRTGLLEYPHYTRPFDFRGRVVPDVLVSGNHQEVSEWRLVMSLALTIERRPDLIELRGGLTPAEMHLMGKYGYCS